MAKVEIKLPLLGEVELSPSVSIDITNLNTPGMTTCHIPNLILTLYQQFHTHP